VSDFKAKPPQFVSIDFLNADLSKSRAINRLAKGIVNFYRSMLLFKNNLLLDEGPIIQALKGKMQLGIEELTDLQKRLLFYMDHVLGNNGKITEEEFADIKKSLDEEDEKLARELQRIGTTPLSEWPNLKVSNPGTLGAIRPILCYDLRRRVPYHELIKCRNCNKFVISKKKVYCSTLCKDFYNNRRRTKSGERAKYMREWRKRKKETNNP
jgi:hypothetical protein